MIILRQKEYSEGSLVDTKTFLKQYPKASAINALSGNKNIRLHTNEISTSQTGHKYNVADTVWNDVGEGVDWIKNYYPMANDGVSYHNDLYFNKKTGKWCSFDLDNVGPGIQEKDIVSEFNSPKEWAKYVESYYRPKEGKDTKTDHKKEQDPFSLNPEWEQYRNPKTKWQAFNNGSIKYGKYKDGAFQGTSISGGLRGLKEFNKNK